MTSIRKPVVLYKTQNRSIEQQPSTIKMSSFENESTRVNTPPSYLDSNVEQGIRRPTGQEGPRATNEQPPEDLPIYTREPVGRASTDEKTVDQGVTDHAVEMADLAILRCNYAEQQDEIASLRRQLADITAALYPPQPAQLAAPSPSDSDSWLKDVELGDDDKHKYGHIASNEGSGNSILQSGRPGDPVHNRGSGEDISQENDESYSTKGRTLCYVIAIVWPIVWCGAMATALYFAFR